MRTPAPDPGGSRALLRGRRAEAAWTAFVVLVVVVGLATSDGEPVCEGPFIWQVDDSLPPQCPSPFEALPMVAVAAVIVWAIGVGVILAVRVRRRDAGGRP